MDKEIIRKVWTTKSTGQNLITIPKDCDIVAGDYIRIIKVEPHIEPEKKDVVTEMEKEVEAHEEEKRPEPKPIKQSEPAPEPRSIPEPEQSGFGGPGLSRHDGDSGIGGQEFDAQELIEQSESEPEEEVETEVIQPEPSKPVRRSGSDSDVTRERIVIRRNP